MTKTIPGFTAIGLPKIIPVRSSPGSHVSRSVSNAVLPRTRARSDCNPTSITDTNGRVLPE